MLKKLFKWLHRDVLMIRLPKTLLISNIKLDEAHKKAVLAENAIERKWHHNTPSFKSPEQILSAFATHRLAYVEPNENLLTIRRLRNPQLISTYPSYLTVYANKLLLEIGQRWRETMNAAGYDPQIRIAVTSLIRTLPYQNTLVAAGKLADPDSAHTRGEAFDLDGSGYYIGETPINPRTSMQSDFEAAFKSLGVITTHEDFGDFTLYIHDVHVLLKQVLKTMQSENKLHFVHEYPDSGNDCFHVCRNPEYQG